MIKRKGEIPLLVAISKRSYKLVELLLHHGADPQTRGKGKDTAISLAKNMKEIKDLLLSYDTKEKKGRAATYDIPDRNPQPIKSNRKQTIDSNKSKDSAEDEEIVEDGLSDDEFEFGVLDITEPKDQKKIIQEAAVLMNS